MRLVRYNPLHEARVFGDSFNHFFNDTFFKNTPTAKSFYPAVDILNKGDNILLNVELPGVSKEDISINIEEKVLTIKGERKSEKKEKTDKYFRQERVYGSFKRSFSLSDDILTDEVSADFKDGILNVTLKRDTTKEEVKQITIN